MGETLGNAQDASLGETFGNGILSGQVLLVYICIVYRGLLEVPSKSIDRGQRGLIALDARLPDWARPERGQIGQIGLGCPIARLALDARLPDWPWTPDCSIGQDARLPDASKCPIARPVPMLDFPTASARLAPDCFPPTS